MKIGVHDVQHIIGQIKRASPPTTKDMHKFINSLAILLEKNTDKLASPHEQTLTGHLERLNELFLDLCFLRKELALKYADEYAASVGAAISTLNANNELLQAESLPEVRSMEWDLSTGSSDTQMLVHEIFGKMHKAKAIIEDALSSSTAKPVHASPDTMLESYLGRI
ncbi:hypothetical protein PAPHI01_0650 [Pancytospora philotis]|nr:hypothetical protein PAPHI01_0650 [Pancytospora philotis]